MDQEASIRFRYELAGDGIQAVETATGKVVALATAEQLAAQRAAELSKALEDAASVRPANPPQVPAASGGSRQPSGSPRPASPDERQKAVAAVLLPERLRTPAPERPSLLTPPADRPARLDTLTRDIAGTLPRPPVRAPAPLRDNPLLDEAFGETAPKPVRAPALAPPGVPPGQAQRLADGDARLARALDGLAVETRRLAEAYRGGAGGGGGGERRESTVLPRRGESDDAVGRLLAGDRGAIRDRERADARAREEQASEFRRQLEAKRQGGEGGGTGLPWRTALGGAAMGVNVGAGLARNADTPFVDGYDRFWQNARMFSIPGTSIGVSGLRDAMLHVQRKMENIDPDDEARKRIEIENTDALVRRPYFEHSLSYGVQLRDLEQRVRDSHGPDFVAVGRPPQEPRRGPGGGKESGDLFDDAMEKYRAATEERQNRMAAARFAPTFPLPDLPSQQRDTLREQQRYERESALLPARDRSVLAGREVRAAEARLSALEGRYRETEKRIADADKALKDTQREIEHQSKLENRDQVERLKGVRADQSKALFGATQELRTLDDEQLGVRQELARARGGERASLLDVKRTDLTLLGQREQVARSQAGRLADLGPAGREQAQYAFDIIKEVGYDNTPEEIRAMARPAFGQTLQKMAEKEGQQFVPQFKATAPDEYRDTLPGIRAEVDRLTAEVRRGETDSAADVLKDLLEALRSMESRYDRLTGELKAFVKQYEAETRQRNNGDR